jgi:hypothetical protein
MGGRHQISVETLLPTVVAAEIHTAIPVRIFFQMATPYRAVADTTKINGLKPVV